MARPKKMYAIVDVETARGFDTPTVYDLGLTIADRNGEIYYKKMWLIKEVITNRKYMHTAYYKDKLPLYRQMFKDDNSILVPFKQAKAEFNELLESFGVDTVAAYNLGFDLGALKYTNYKYDYENGSGWDMCRFFSKEYNFICIWGASCESLCMQSTYRKMASKQGWLTEYGNISTNAENVYRYISKDYDFKEQHTGLADCEIELQILVRVFKTKVKITQNEIIPHPWRMVQLES